MGQSAGTLGIDLGSVNVKAAWLPPGGGACGEPGFWAPALGRPLAALSRLLDGPMLDALGAGGPMVVSLTGVAQGLFEPLGLPAARLNEVVATALAVARAVPGAKTVIDVGGQFTKWILLDGERVADFAINGLCAAGSGAFLEQQAARLQLSAPELGRLACEARRGATVAGRCSVFAKSDMIHLQQKGTPVEEIAYGVCLALARTFAATVLGGRRVAPPVVVVGGGAANPGLVRAFRQVLGLAARDVVVPPDHMTIGARGAAIASDGATATRTTTLEALAEALRAGAPPRGSGTSKLAPLGPHAVRDARPEEDPARTSSGAVRVYLGVDVGSVSTNVVLLSDDGQVLQGLYLPTRGRPVEVLDQALRQVGARYGEDLEVLAVGATGSGRHLAAKALGADTVKNEITAQITSAARYFPEVDTVFEIGGQDSKFIGARAGRLSRFEMNKICAAGTGSFLEEQAERLGVDLRGSFAELALRSAAPRDLGSRCTVFMDTELVRALEQGASLEDVCAGLAYSIARNYLEKVVAGHAVGDVVVFQGGTASNEAVAAAMRALTGKRVVVHPYNRISGAIGVALLAMRDRERSGRPSRFRGLCSCRDARARAFECRGCPNRCQVTRVKVGGLTAHFGDTCERYGERDHDQPEGARPRAGAAPTDLFAARRDLLDRHLPAARPRGPRAVLPRASVCLELAPLWGAVLAELGYDVALTEPSTMDLVELGSAGLPAEVCLPVKVAAGHVRRALSEGAATVVVPAVQEMPLRVGPLGPADARALGPALDGRNHTCLYTQEIPGLLRRLHGGRVLAPQCSLAAVRRGLVEAEEEISRCFGTDDRRARAVLARGLEVQRSFDQARAALGRDALASGADRMAVVLGRPYNVHDPLLNLGLARRLESIGLRAIPMDLLPLDEVRLPPELDQLQWRFSRDQLRALALTLSRDDLFPVWVSSFGCGLDAFASKHLEASLGGRPALMLEFDEHRGEAGLVTRIEAFADEIDEHVRRRGSGRKPARPSSAPRAPRSPGRFVVPAISDHAWPVAAMLRAAGYEAQVLPTPDQTTVLLGEEHTNGRECHPFVVMSGELVRWARSAEARPGDVFYYPQSVNPCLISQYGDGHRLLLRRLGIDHVTVRGLSTSDLVKWLGYESALRLYEGVAAADILFSATCAYRAGAARPAEVDRVHDESLRSICEMMERRKRVLDAVVEGLARLEALPREPGERPRPLVGVCGDLYTRVNPVANGDLFARLEAMGCRVWPHPYLAGLVDSGSYRQALRLATRGVVGSCLFELFVNLASSRLARPSRRAVPSAIRRLVLEPEPAELVALAAPYLGPRANNLVLENVAKSVDFARGGADGVVNAIGIGCMVGVVTEALLRRVRADYPEVPMVTLAYGCTEGPAQRVRLETFVHQVHERFRRRDGAAVAWAGLTSRAGRTPEPSRRAALAR